MAFILQTKKNLFYSLPVCGVRSLTSTEKEHRNILRQRVGLLGLPAQRDRLMCIFTGQNLRHADDEEGTIIGQDVTFSVESATCQRLLVSWILVECKLLSPNISLLLKEGNGGSFCLLPGEIRSLPLAPDNFINRVHGEIKTSIRLAYKVVGKSVFHQSQSVLLSVLMSNK